VPTMGALHDGHRALLRAARAENDRVVMSLFVNPTQFAAGEDFDRYPRDEQRDRRIAAEEGVDEVFAPTVEQMYPEGFATRVEVAGVADRYEGAARPGHFAGVATVVLKLLHLIAPDRVWEYGAYAFRNLKSGVPGPVHLDFPGEVARMKFTDPSKLKDYYTKEKYRTESRAFPSPKEVEKAADRHFVRQPQRYFAVTIKGRLRSRWIVPAPFFVASDMTYPIQAADLCNYCVNWGFRVPSIGMDAAVRPEIESEFRPWLDMLQFRGEGHRQGAAFKSFGVAFVPDPYNTGTGA